MTHAAARDSGFCVPADLTGLQFRSSWDVRDLYRNLAKTLSLKP